MGTDQYRDGIWSLRVLKILPTQVAIPSFTLC